LIALEPESSNCIFKSYTFEINFQSGFNRGCLNAIGINAGKGLVCIREAIALDLATGLYVKAVDSQFNKGFWIIAVLNAGFFNLPLA